MRSLSSATISCLPPGRTLLSAYRIELFGVPSSPSSSPSSFSSSPLPRVELIVCWAVSPRNSHGQSRTQPGSPRSYHEAAPELLLLLRFCRCLSLARPRLRLCNGAVQATALQQLR